MRFSALIRVVCLLALALSEVCSAEIPARGELNLSSQALGEALQALAKARGVQIVFDPSEVGSQRTSGLSGSMTTDEALQRLLKSTDLVYCYLPSGTVEITRPQADAACAKSSPISRTSTASGSEEDRRKKRRLAGAQPNIGPPVPQAQVPLDIVSVTGTMIESEPVGTASLRITREDFDSGAIAQSADFSRTVPSVFGGGPSQSTRLGVEAQSNAAFGTGLNVRGLGARATLVLMDGVRLAPGGTQGAYVDIENIPLSAVDHVDIYPDSASAAYGADAVGGVVNFVMRRDFTGAETLARVGTGGDFGEYVISQLAGIRWDDGSAMIAMEVGRRGAQAAASRSYAVSDLRPFGGEDFDTNLANPGNIVIGNESYALPPGQNGTHLTAADLQPGTVNLQNRYLDTDILPSQKHWAVYASEHHQVNERFSAWLDVLESNRDAAERQSAVATSILVPSTNPFYVNPIGGQAPVVVDYNFGPDLGPTTTQSSVSSTNATLGLDFDAGGEWQIRTYVNYASERERTTNANQVNFTALQLALASSDPASAFNPFGQGSNTSSTVLNAIRSDEVRRQNSTLRVIDLLAKGPVVRLPTGELKATAGVDQRGQSFYSVAPALSGTIPGSLWLVERTRAAFADLRLPLLGGEVTFPGVQAVNLSAALRKEVNSAFGSTTAPKFGGVWLVGESLSFRATWSRAMRPPALEELADRDNTITALTLPYGGAAIPALLITGNNSQLHSEHARSWTSGLDFAPRELPGLSFALTYFNVAYTDRIQSAPFSSNLLTDPQYAALVTSDPSPALIDSLCQSNRFYQGSSLTCTAYPAGAVVDLRERNIARLWTQGVDVAANFDWFTRMGEFRFSLLGTRLLEFAQANTPTDPLTSLLSTQNNPIDLRLWGAANWDWGSWGARIVANFTDSYWNTEVVPNQRVSSWTTLDALVSYRIHGDQESLFKEIKFYLTAQNVFNKTPPFLDNPLLGIGFDQENANSLGRLLRLEMRVSW